MVTGSLDSEIFLAIQGIRGNGLLEAAMILSAELLVFLIPLSLLYFWYTDTGERKAYLYVFVTAVLAVALSYVMGRFYSHPPPHGIYRSMQWGGAENAFPSQHTTVMFATAFGYLWTNRRRVGSVFLGAATLTGFARVFTGSHWPVDILGGIAAAAVGLGAVHLFSSQLEWPIEQAIDLYERVETWAYQWIETAETDSNT